MRVALLQDARAADDGGAGPVDGDYGRAVEPFGLLHAVEFEVLVAFVAGEDEGGGDRYGTGAGEVE